MYTMVAICLTYIKCLIVWGPTEVICAPPVLWGGHSLSLHSFFCYSKKFEHSQTLGMKPPRVVFTHHQLPAERQYPSPDPNARNSCRWQHHPWIFEPEIEGLCYSKLVLILSGSQITTQGKCLKYKLHFGSLKGLHFLLIPKLRDLYFRSKSSL